MPVYRTRPEAESYGYCIGILLLDAQLPFIPGDVANVTSFRNPPIYRVVSGLTRRDCLEAAPDAARAVVAAAKELEASGVRGISSNCGFMLNFQDAVREAVNIPVCLSSLLQLPLIARSLDPARPIAVITADAAQLDLAFLERAGVKPANPIIMRGMQDRAEFASAVLGAKGSLDSDAITAEAVQVAREIAREHADLGAILLECAMLPPYARAVQDAVGCPVHDFVTMIDYLRSGAQQRRHDGLY